MKTKYTILFLLALSLVACNKETPSATSIEGLKGKWAPIHEDWLTDKYLEFDKGYLTTYSLPGSFFAKDQKIWGWTDEASKEIIRKPYSVTNGRLYVGRDNLGPCHIQNDTLLLDEVPYMRVNQLTEAYYTFYYFGENINPQDPVLKVGKAQKDITIACYLVDEVPFKTAPTLYTSSYRLNNIRLKPAASENEKDSLSFQIDANTSGKTLKELLYIHHPASGFTILEVEQSGL